MMSKCAVCGAGTDLAIEDVLTRKQFARLSELKIDIPLVGNCGRRDCISQQYYRLIDSKENER